MAGPWEEYQTKSGPWEEYQAPKPSPAPQEKMGFGDFGVAAGGEAMRQLGLYSGGETGAELGAGIGTMIAPGIGTLIGGGLGAIGGGLAGYYGMGKLGEATGLAKREQEAAARSPTAAEAGKLLAEAPLGVKAAYDISKVAAPYVRRAAAPIISKAYGGAPERAAKELQKVFGTSAISRSEAAEQEAARLRRAREQIEAGRPVTEQRYAAEAAPPVTRPPGYQTQAPTIEQAREQALAKLRAEAREAGAEVATAGAPEAAAVRAEVSAAPAAPIRGKNLLDTITTNVNKLKTNLKNLADEAYKEADTAMDTRFRQGDYWQSSKSGKDFISNLQKRISTEKVTEETAATRADLQKILNDVRGVINPETKKLSPSSPKVLRETLRLLRDRARGVPETGFDAIEQQAAGNLAKELADAIKPWESKLAEADQLYRTNAETLSPTKTVRAKRVLKPGEVDYKTPGVDPSSIPGTFFKSDQSVDELRALTNNDALVEQEAYNHVLDNIKNKDASAARNWLEGQRNWLRPKTGTDPGNLQNVYAKADALISRLEQAEGKSVSAAERAKKAKGLVGKGAERLGAALKTTEPTPSLAARLSRVEKAAGKISAAEEKAQQAANVYRKFETDLSKAKSPKEIVSISKQYVSDLFDPKNPIISREQYIEFNNQIDRVQSQIASKEEARRIIKRIALAIGIPAAAEEIIRRRF